MAYELLEKIPFQKLIAREQNNEDIAVCLSPQLRSSSRALLNENSLTTLFPDDVDGGSGWVA